MKEKGEQEKGKALFASLVMMLSTSAMQYMGKIADLVSSETKIDLESAQVIIDMLAMLKQRTNGHLEKDESRMLNDVLTSLRMNYVESEDNRAGCTTNNPDTAK